MRDQDSTAPGTGRDVRPPIPPDSAPHPGAVEAHTRAEIKARLRPTVWPRALVSPEVWVSEEPGYPASSRYVRTFWTAALGPGAVADLLRLATAADRGRSLRRPAGLSALCAAGLAREIRGKLQIRTTIPRLSGQQLRALHPAVRRLHEEERWLDEIGPAAA